MFQTISMNIYPTYACNLECTYCFQDNTKTEFGDVMDIQTVTDVMKKTVGYQHVNVNYIGGEPTLVGLEHLDKMHKAALKVLQANNTPCSFQMITNGVLLTQEWFDWADKNDIYFVVSYDGAGKKHPLTKKNLPLLAKKQSKHSIYTLADNVHTVVQRHNINHLTKTIDDLTQAGITKMFLVCDVELDQDNIEQYYRGLCQVWDYINDNRLGLYASLFMDLISYQSYRRTNEFPRRRYHFEMGSFNLGVEVHVMPNGLVRQTLPEVAGSYSHHSNYKHMYDYFASPIYTQYIQDWITSLTTKTGNKEVDDFITYTRDGGLFFFAKLSASNSLSKPYVPHINLMIRLSEYIVSKPINDRYYRKLLK